MNTFRMTRILLAILTPMLILGLFPQAAAADSPTGDPDVLSLMQHINQQLHARGLNLAIEKIELYTIGDSRPSNRIHQQEQRFVPGDPRRLANGNNITYLVDQSDGATLSGLTNDQTEVAIDQALDTWQADSCMAKVNLIKRADTGVDPDFTDAEFGFGGSGDPFLADIVFAGWLPRAFFDAFSGSGCGHCVLATSAIYIFTDDNGVPTDINGDNYLDTALTEIYFNNTFGDPADDRVGNPWAINQSRPAIDVETVALHETGHALGLGHFGPKPLALMNARYNGINQTPDPTDHAGLCAVWAAWPQ